MMGNMFNLTFRFSAGGVSRWRAVSRDGADYRLLGSYDYRTPLTTASRIARYIFPYTLTFVSTSDSLAYPRVDNFSAKALILNVVCAAILLVANRRRKSLAGYCGTVITLACGVFAFIPFIIFRD